MRKIVGSRTLKTGIGATLAMLIAQGMGLKYSASAGIVAILSIQNTKKQSVEMAVNRFYATLIALALSSLLFVVFGFNAIVFGVYVTIFIPIAVKLRIVEGIVPASVLVTHLLGEGHISLELLMNEVLILLVGAGVALLLNLYMPSAEQELQVLRHQAEKQMHDLFMGMTEALLANSNQISDAYLLNDIEATLRKGKSRAYKHSNNYFFAHATLYERYFDMRLNQFQVLCYMQEHFRRFFMQYQETQEVADFTSAVAESVHGKKTSYVLLEELEELRNYFRESHLPQTREEFENRAMLYQFLNDLEHFLEIKKEFKENLSEEEVEEYEQGYEI